MNIRNITLFASALACAVALSGCNGYDTDYHGDSVRAEASHNVLGIIKTNPNSYRYVEESATITLDTDELWCRRDFSGQNISLFWGLINIRDY